MVTKSPLNKRKDEADVVCENPYSAFSSSHRAGIVVLITATTWFSTLSSFIYFPAVSSLARDLHVSVQQINLTVTAYMVASALVPMVVGGAADGLGRRPVCLITLTVYLAANVGLALQRDFITLLGLRVMQSVGISGKSRN